MVERVLVDTGPIVAMIVRQDIRHGVCTTQAKRLNRTLYTSWPVLTEAAWLLRSTAGGVRRLFTHVEQGLLAPLDLDAAFAGWLNKFLAKYADLSPQLADGSLLYLAEREGVHTVFTLDRRDFTVFRLKNGQPLRLVPDRF